MMLALHDICEKFIKHQVSHERWLFDVVKACVLDIRLSIKVAQAIFHYNRSEGEG